MNLQEIIKQQQEKRVTPLVMDMRWINKPNYRDYLDTLISQTAHTTALAVVEMCEGMRYEEERAQQWISKGGVDYIDNKARLDFLNKIITALKAEVSTLST